MCEGVLTISKQEGRDIDLIPTDTSGPMTDTLSLRSRGSNEHFGNATGSKNEEEGEVVVRVSLVRVSGDGANLRQISDEKFIDSIKKKLIVEDFHLSRHLVFHHL